MVEKHKNDEVFKFFEGLNTSSFSIRETYELARRIALSGELLDIQNKVGVTITKASIGDISDTVSLVAMSVLSALGEKIVKVTSKNHGKFTNNLSRLCSIEGFMPATNADELVEKTNACSVGIIENQEKIVPADKILMMMLSRFEKPNIPLLAASLVAKKIALSPSIAVFDIKIGEGGIVKSREDGFTLGNYLVGACAINNIKSACVVTSLSEPIPSSIGTTLELREVIKVLSSGEGYFSSNLLKVSREIVVIALLLLKRCSGRENASELFDECITSGKALEQFKKIISCYGGDISSITSDLSLFSGVQTSYLLSPCDGYLTNIDSYGVYCASQILSTLDGEKIDKNAGIVLIAREGEKLQCGERVLGITYSFDNINFKRCYKYLENSVQIKNQKPSIEKLFIKVIV